MRNHYDYPEDQRASPVLAALVGLGVLASLIFLGLLALRMVDTSGPDSATVLPPPPVDRPIAIDLLQPVCDLRDEKCYVDYVRQAIGGDPMAQFFLIRFFEPGNGSSALNPTPSLTIPGEPDPVEAFAWASFSSCTFDLDYAKRTGGGQALCPSSYMTQLQNMGSYQSGYGDSYETCNCSRDFTELQCNDALLRMRDYASSRRDSLSLSLSDAEVQRARDRVEQRLVGNPDYGHVTVGRMYLQQCPFERSTVKAACHFKVAMEMGSSRAAEEYRALFSQLTTDQRQAAEACAEGYMPGMRLQREQEKRISALRADEIPARDLQFALKALGLYSGAIDGRIGPATGAAISRFKECERIAPYDASLTDQTRIRIIRRAALGGENDSGMFMRDCYNIMRKHPRSLHLMGIMHMEGIGLPQDLAAAEQYFLEAADGGFDPSLAGLAMLYYEHKGRRGETPSERDVRLRQACNYLNLAEQHYRDDRLPFMESYAFLLRDLEEMTRGAFGDTCSTL